MRDLMTVSRCNNSNRAWQCPAIYCRSSGFGSRMDWRKGEGGVSEEK